MGVADGYDTRSTASRQSLNFGALLAGAGAATVAALGALGGGGGAIAGIPIGTAFLSGTSTIYASEPKALIYRYASDNIKELVRIQDDKVEADDPTSRANASCLQGNVHAVMRKVGEYIALLDPRNVAERLKVAGTGDQGALQKLAVSVNSDYSDLKRVATECPTAMTVDTPVLEIPVGGSTTLTITGGTDVYTAAPLDAAATQALTVAPPAASAAGAVVAIKASDSARPGDYGILVKDGVGTPMVVVVKVKSTVIPAFAVVDALGGRPIELGAKDVIAGVLSGGVTPYVARVVSGQEGALSAKLEPGPAGSTANVVKVALAEGAREGRTYTVLVEDKADQRKYLDVLVAAQRLTATMVPVAQPIRRGDRAVFVIAGGSPPYRMVGPVIGSESALTVTPPPGTDLAVPTFDVQLTGDARPGAQYLLRITDTRRVERDVVVTVAADTAPSSASRSDEFLRRAQETLRDKGLNPPDNVDGKFGPRTSAAVLAFQKREKLRETAVLDSETLKALGIQ